MKVNLKSHFAMKYILNSISVLIVCIPGFSKEVKREFSVGTGTLSRP